MTLGDGFPPFYAERHIPVFHDIRITYLIFTFIALYISLMLVTPGFRRKTAMFYVITKTLGLFFGASILACVFGLGWSVSVEDTYFPTKGQFSSLNRYQVGLYIGTDAFNVTFKELDTNKSINYNEEFHFYQIDSELKEAQQRGVPSPILNIADFFAVYSVNSLSIWGRRYWIAGHFTKYMLWAAFGTWVVGTVLLSTFVRYGGLFRILTGLLLLAANISFATANGYCCPLEIHLGLQNTATLKPDYGWSFWLCLGVGILLIGVGVFIFFSDLFCPKTIRRFFDAEIENESSYLIDVETSKSYPSSRRSSVDQPVNGEDFQSSSSPSPQFLSANEPYRRKSVQKMEIFPLEKRVNPSYDDAQDKKDEIEGDSV